MGFARSILNWITGVIAVIAVIGIILSILVVNDMAEFREQFYEKGSVNYLDIDRRIESGFIATNLETEETFDPVPLSELYDVTDNYIDEDYTAMLRGTARVFIFKEAAFDNVEYAKIEDITLPKGQVLTLLKSHTLLDDFTVTTGYLPEQIWGEGLNDDDLRWRLFARLVFTQVEEQGPLFLLKEMKQGNIEVAPKSITFHLFPFVPDAIIEWLADPSTMQKIEEAPL